MDIDVDSVITLENNLNYLILDKAKFNGNKYYLSVKVDEEENALDENIILKEINENGSKYVIKETDESIIKELLVIFTKSFNRSIVNLDDID